MGDPVGVARHIRESLAPGGILMIVEPIAGDNSKDNLHPLDGVFMQHTDLPAELALAGGRPVPGRPGRPQTALIADLLTLFKASACDVQHLP